VLPCLKGVLRGGSVHRREFRAPNGSDVKLQAAHTRERTRGAALAAMHTVLTLSVCKRRDAVRLALNEPARPAGAAFGGLSASAAS
jgi:hypothetical protein